MRYMITIIILELYEQDLCLIEDPLLNIVFLLVIISFLDRARNKMLWQDLMQKQNIDLWPHLLVSLFDLNNYLKNCILERPLKWHLYVTFILLFILAQISSFTKGPNILRWIVILFEKRLYLETSRLSLLIRMID